MNILRSIDVDQVFDNISIVLDKSIGDIFSTSVDKDLIPSGYELQNMKDKRRIIFNYDSHSVEGSTKDGFNIELKDRGYIIKQLDYQNKHELLERLNSEFNNQNFNLENIEIIKFIVSRFLEV